MAHKRAAEERGIVIALAIKRSKKITTKAALLMTLQELEAEEAEKARWWATALQKRVPVLSGGTGDRRGGKMYGQSSNYGRDHTPPVSPRAFYLFFRFAREDIPRLTRALRIPAVVESPSGCKLDGEEALLMFLKVRCFLLWIWVLSAE